jgi:2-oxoglutarate dehydrogenase E1 component
MTRSSFAGSYNLAAIEQAYERWRHDPMSVDESWRLFFEGFDLGLAQKPAGASEAQQTALIRLIDAYRGLGHLLARLDPLSLPPTTTPALELSEFGFSESDLDRTFDTSHFLGLPSGTLRQLIGALRETYCRTLGVEYMHIQDPTIRRWIQERLEPRRSRPEYGRRQKLRILMDLHYAELFEKFLQTRYLGQKRFSLEGAETLIPVLDRLVEAAADSAIREIVLGMAHRGRLNVLANIIGKPYAELFSEFEENYLPNSMAGDGDVKYHLGFSSDRVSSHGNKIHLTLTPNPSHLEAVNPVVEGRVRAKQQFFGDHQRTLCMPLLIHGDAAIAGQGLVAETLNLSQLQGYQTGGTVHVVINNQIGFTTSPTDARSTRYCTDVAKMIEVPIFHVNGEDPEAAAFAAELAVEFRQTFHRDVFIDMYCYRRWGHNESDEPSFTQPVMYAKILERPSLSEVYTETLLMRGDLTYEETQAIVHDFQGRLEKSQQEVKSAPRYVGMKGYQGRWKDMTSQYTMAPVPTGVPLEILERIGLALTRAPQSFRLHPKMARMLEVKARDMREHRPVDWGFAEALSFGSLLLERKPIRLSGQDCRRGTFSQRHAVWYDFQTGEPYTPLEHLDPKQGTFSAYDSLLSEAGVLGFEYGYSLDMPEALVMWEAQFGDFANGAQVIIDQFLASGTSKWQRDSGLVLLLPHGYEGQGPEHSSGRLERFLQLCAEDNMQVCNPSTPAQYFHLLRRQLHRDFRKPLVVMTPKSLLRHKAAVSLLENLVNGLFHEIIDDTIDPARVRRVVLCSGKIYYDLAEQRTKEEHQVAVVRVEQFYPFAAEQIQQAIKRYPKAREVLWVQEESLNMGGWNFIEPRLRALGIKLKYVGRDASASPATGSRHVHLREQKEIVETAIKGSAPHLVRSQPAGQLRRFPTWEDEGIEPAALESNRVTG